MKLFPKEDLLSFYQILQEFMRIKVDVYIVGTDGKLFYFYVLTITSGSLPTLNLDSLSKEQVFLQSPRRKSNLWLNQYGNSIFIFQLCRYVIK